MKKNKMNNKKIKNLFMICFLSAILLVVSTYAWFIGMDTVTIDEFEVEIASVDSLLLSMDGVTWDTSIQPGVDEEYENNTNKFLKEDGEGLKPISSVGEFDLTTSRLKLFEKGSLTATEGGYRLMASRVGNTVQLKDASGQTVEGQYVEKDGYVAFDMFVMNLSGSAYYEEITTPSNEEDIYMTYDSSVKVSTAGDQSGIENSVRVAFAQIGRIEAKHVLDGNVDGTEQSVSSITGITCNLDNSGKPSYTEANGVTGICRNAAIWEPNERNHVDGAVSWYKKSCKARKTKETPEGGEEISYVNTFAYAGTCADLEATENINGEDYTKYYPTNAINSEISETDYVDVYDGKYNGFTAASKLTEVSTFTDMTKLQTGNNRQSIFTLAPNSITKIRVYIWIEGQDVDNYDFASLGKGVKISFGFTKERFTTGEIDENMNNVPGDAEKLPEIES